MQEQDFAGSYYQGQQIAATWSFTSPWDNSIMVADIDQQQKEW